MYIDTRNRYGKPVIAKAINLWIDIQAPIETVFQYLTQADKLNGWWATRCSSDPRPGGRLVFIWEGEQERVGEALFRQFEPPHRVVLQWVRADGDDIRSDASDRRGMRWIPINEYNLAQLDESFTRLHIHDHGINNTDPYAALFEATCEGWYQAAKRLKRVIERASRGTS